MRKLALFDFDKTIYNGTSFFDMVKHMEKEKLISPGLWPRVELEIVAYKTGKSYKDAADSMLSLVASELSETDYEFAYDLTKNFLAENKDKFFPYFEEIQPYLLQEHDVYIVTTNVDFVADAVVEMFELKGAISSVFETDGLFFTGKVEKSLAGNKSEVKSLIEKYGWEGSIAVGDSENDIDMLLEVETPVCINPDTKLKKHAEEAGWDIVTDDTAEKYFISLLG